jgi:hypothetical protein
LFLTGGIGIAFGKKGKNMDSHARLNRAVNRKESRDRENKERGLEIDDSRASQASASPGSGTSESYDAAYFKAQPRPPFDDGMSDLSDPLFLAFCRGEIPDDPERQSRIAEICINSGFARSLAWLIVKTKMTQLSYCSVGQLDTIAKTLGCLGLPLHKLHLDLPGLHLSSLEKFITSVDSSHTLKRVDFCDTPMSRTGSMRSRDLTETSLCWEESSMTAFPPTRGRGAEMCRLWHWAEPD